MLQTLTGVNPCEGVFIAEGHDVELEDLDASENNPPGSGAESEPEFDPDSQRRQTQRKKFKLNFEQGVKAPGNAAAIERAAHLVYKEQTVSRCTSSGMISCDRTITHLCLFRTHAAAL